MPPEWFTRSVGLPYEEAGVVVRGVRIHYARWGRAAGPSSAPLLFVHGGAAHLHWWTPLVGFFVPPYDVVAVDLSGHGDSGWREAYTRAIWAEELIAVAGDAWPERSAILVAHSLGGLASIAAAAREGAAVRGLVVVDPPMRAPDPPAGDVPRIRAVPAYPDLASAMARFRLIPPQPAGQRDMMEYAARHSFQASPGEVRYKFDPRITEATTDRSAWEDLAHVHCPRALIYGTESAVLPPETRGPLIALFPPDAAVGIERAYHHVPMDAPEAFAAAVLRFAADWA
jgi:pimeloyl-ACP methyl ester carboxylesterase